MKYFVLTGSSTPARLLVCCEAESQLEAIVVDAYGEYDFTQRGSIEFGDFTIAEIPMTDALVMAKHMTMLGSEDPALEGATVISVAGKYADFAYVTAPWESDALYESFCQAFSYIEGGLEMQNGS